MMMAALCALACGLSPVYAQDNSYGQAIQSINQFQAAKHYTPATTGPLFARIVDDLAFYQGYNMSEGLKKRLVGGSNNNKFNQQLNGTDSLADRNLLHLLRLTQQTVNTNTEDATLRSKAAHNGISIVTPIKALWANKQINSDLIESLDYLDPISAMEMAWAIAYPWYSPSKPIYENSFKTLAAESLFEIKTDMSLVELAKRSALIKLLRDNLGFYIPDEVDAQFLWSGKPSIPIYLDEVTWSSADVPELQTLLDSPYYARWAKEELYNLGY